MGASVEAAAAAWLGRTTTAFRDSFANPHLRRLQLAAAGSTLANWAYAIGFVVFAFESGGAAAVGLVALIRALPAALASPFAATLGDRYAPVRVMLGSDLVRAALMGAMVASVALDLPDGLVYGLGAAASMASRAFRPAQAALLPTLARTPEELTAANAVSATVQNVALFAGPALGGLLLVATGPSVLFAINAVGYLWSAFLIAGLLSRDVTSREPAASARRPALLRGSFAGFGVVARHRGVLGLVILVGVQLLVYGALTVLAAVLAFDLLETGAAGLGVLQAALGIGGLLGSVAALGLAGGRHLGLAFLTANALWGLPLAATGLWPNEVAALLLLMAAGVANTIADVAEVTLLQRAVDADVLARVFGVFELLTLLAVPLGALVAAPLIEAVGIRAALVVVGLLPVLAVLTARDVLSLETPPDRAREVSVLRALPIFSPLPPETLDRLAASLDPVTAPPGTEIIRQGERGDRFYVVARGAVEVIADGRTLARLGAGECFGEIALIEDVPRTATVTTQDGAELLALDGEAFLEAVRSHPTSADAAGAVVAARLSGLRTVS